MAIWQYDLILLGEGDATPLPGNDGWELPQLSAASTLRAQESLIEPLGYPWLMMEDWVVFGNESGTRVDLFFDEEDTVGIRVRLDASATQAELETICVFVRALKGRLFDPASQTVLQADRASLASALAASNAAAFCRAPRSYLAGQSKG